MTPTNERDNRPLLCESPGCNRPLTEPWEDTSRYCPDCSVQIELFDRQGRWDRIALLHRIDQLRLALGSIA